LLNLIEVIRFGGLPPLALTIYVYYLLRNEEPTPYHRIKRDIHLSSASVHTHNKALKALGVLEIGGPSSTASKAGYTNIYRVKGFSDDQLKAFLGSKGLDLKREGGGGLLPSSSYIINIYNKDKDIRRKIFNKMYRYKQKEERAGAVPAQKLSKKVPAIAAILNELPEDQKNFKVTESAKKRLEELASKIDVARYARWFVRVKLIRLIPRFNMGIFLYAGMVEEYRATLKRTEKVDKYKTVSSRLKKSYDKRAERFKKEMEAIE